MKKKEKIAIYLKSTEKNLKINLIYIIKLLKTNKNIKYKISNMPIKNKRLALLKSPHINKKAIEHFEIKRYKTVIYIETEIQKKVEDINFYKKLILNKPNDVKMTLRKII